MKRVNSLLFEGGRDTPGLIRGQPMINVLQLISGCPYFLNIIAVYHTLETNS
jgi:hypothetical protein